MPVVDIAAGKLRAVALGTQHIAWRVAGAAMRQPFDQIGTAVPFGALFGIGLIGVVTKEKQFPPSNGGPLVERERKLVFARRRADGLPRHQEGIECPVILIADIGEVVVWECRIKVLAFTIDAGAHRALKRGFRPSPDSRLRVRRDVRGEDRAERGRHRQTAGKVPAAAHGMAIVAIADRRQITTSFDEGGIEGQRPGRLHRRNRRAPHDCKDSRRAAKQHDGNDAGDNSGRSRHPLPLCLLLLGCILTQITRRRSPGKATITASLPCREPARPRWWECRIWIGRAMIDGNLDFLSQRHLRATPDRTT